MDDAELRAAEYVRDNQVSYDAGFDDHRIVDTVFTRLAKALAADYLRRVPADAGVAADAAWALSLIAPPSPDLVASSDDYGADGFCVDVWVPISKWHSGHSLIRLPFRHGTTRGQVRDVLRGLGVAMKEGA